MNGRIEVDELILMSAVRYALGRRTYIVGSVCNEYKNHIQELSTNALSCTYRDINEQFEMYGAEGLGDDCDRVLWYELLNLIEKELDFRDYKFPGYYKPM